MHTDIHASSGIRTDNPSVRADEDGSCLRPRSHFNRPVNLLIVFNLYYVDMVLRLQLVIPCLRCEVTSAVDITLLNGIGLILRRAVNFFSDFC
jgi:hypothetical protein